MNVNVERTSYNQFNVKVFVGTKEEITAYKSAAMQATLKLKC